MRTYLVVVVLLCCRIFASAQSLEIHQIAVGVGDAGLIIQRNVDSLRTRVHRTKPAIPDSSLLQEALAGGMDLIGTVVRSVLVDLGPIGRTNEVRTYMQQMGVIEPTYVFISHYHTDHIYGRTLIGPNSVVYDRGDTLELEKLKGPALSYKAVRRAQRVSHKAKAADTLLFRPPPVAALPNIELKCVAANKMVVGAAAGLAGSKSENDAGVAWKLTYGAFTYYTGGDLGGNQDPTNKKYIDVESPLAPQVGHVCAMKVNHHGSEHSNNATFLSTLRPAVAVISCGTKYGHPSIAAKAIIDYNSRYTACTINRTTGKEYNIVLVVCDNQIATESWLKMYYSECGTQFLKPFTPLFRCH